VIGKRSLVNCKIQSSPCFTFKAELTNKTELHCATKFGSCLVLGVLTIGLYSLVTKTTETAFFSAVKIRLGSGDFFSEK